MKAPLSRNPDLWPAELGVTQASRLAGIPEVTLRLHVDQGKVLGVRRTGAGRRQISRQGLLAYMQARGLDPSRRGDAETAGAARVLVSWGGRFLESRLERVRSRSLEVSGIPWQGPLPDPEVPLAFRIEGGAFDGVEGSARAAWVLWKGGELELSLKPARELEAKASPAQ